MLWFFQNLRLFYLQRIVNDVKSNIPKVEKFPSVIASTGVLPFDSSTSSGIFKDIWKLSSVVAPHDVKKRMLFLPVWMQSIPFGSVISTFFCMAHQKLLVTRTWTIVLFPIKSKSFLTLIRYPLAIYRMYTIYVLFFLYP